MAVTKAISQPTPTWHIFNVRSTRMAHSSTHSQITTEAQVVNGFLQLCRISRMYGATVDVAQVNEIYNVLFGRDGDVAGVTWWANQIVTGKVAPAAAAIAILNGAQGSDKVIVENKLAASAAFTASLDTMHRNYRL